MPLNVADRVRETTTTTGTGTITLSGTSPTGYQTFSAVGNGNTTYYTINAGAQWEVGIGTYLGAGPTLSRDTVLASSNAGALVNFSAGTKDVFCDYPASKSISDGFGLLPIANGGTGATTAGGARTALGATTVGGNVFTLANPSAITFPRFNADNTVSALDAAAFRTAIGAGTSSTTGTVTSVAGTGTVNGITLTGTVTSSGSLTLGGTLSGVNLTTQVTGTLPVANGGTGATTLTSGYLLKGNDTSAVSASIIYDTGTNVGIGTSSPFVKFQIDQNQAAYSYFDYYNTTAGGGIVWRQIFRNIANTGNATVDFAKLIGGGFALNNGDTNAANFTSFGVGASERMRIDSSGNVGIGTSSPSYKLDVTGQGRATTGWAVSTDGSAFTPSGLNAIPNYGTGYITSTAITTVAGFGGISAYTNQLERMRIDGSGNVGIGTSSTTAGYGSGKSLILTNQSSVLFQNASNTWNTSTAGGGVTYFSDNNLYLDAKDSASNMIFRVNGATERMRIDSSGNVGIGTSSPAFKLDVGSFSTASTQTIQVAAASGNDAQLKLMEAASTFGFTIRNANGSGLNFLRHSADATGVTAMFIGRDTGNVGIGTTSPGRKLTVSSADDTPIQATSSGANSFIQATGSSGSVYFGAIGTAFGVLTNTTERMRIDSSGNVGIGTSTPSTLLHASGVGSELRSQNTSTTQYQSGRVRLKGPAGTYRSTAMVHGNGNTGGTNTYFAIEGADSSDNYLQTMALYDYASQFWLFSTNNTERMRITSAGNVGIGSSAPITRLYAETPVNTGSTIAFSGNANATYPATVFGGSFGYNFSAGGAEVDFWNGWTGASGAQGGFAFRRQTGASSQNLLMLVRGDGNVGINTDAPATKLDVVGNVLAREDNSAGATPVLVRNSNSGNNTTKSSSALFQGTDTVGTVKNIGSVGFFPDDANYISANLRFLVRSGDAAPTERMRIDSSGNVGIGTTGPGYRLDVAAADTTAGLGYAARLRSNATATAAALQFTNSAVSAENGLIACTDAGLITVQGSSAMAFRTNGNERGRFNSSGEFLTGTTVGGRAVCMYASDMWLRLSNASRQWLIGPSTGTSFRIWDETGGASRLEIDATGSTILTGLLVGRNSASTDVNSANDTGSISVRGSTTTVASMSFHRAGAYAINMGLGTDNVFRIGGWSASSNCFQMDGSGNLTMLGNVTAYSDARMKKDVVTIDNALDLVGKMRGVKYTRKDTGKAGVGVIAQEMLEVVPEVVQQGIGADDTLSVAYGNLVGVLIEAIKELEARVAQLEGK
jgi:hypothetical protein